jgi:hypothetical protein
MVSNAATFSVMNCGSATFNNLSFSLAAIAEQYRAAHLKNNPDYPQVRANFDQHSLSLFCQRLL